MYTNMIVPHQADTARHRPRPPIRRMPPAKNPSLSDSTRQLVQAGGQLRSAGGRTSGPDSGRLRRAGHSIRRQDRRETRLGRGAGDDLHVRSSTGCRLSLGREFTGRASGVLGQRGEVHPILRIDSEFGGELHNLIEHLVSGGPARSMPSPAECN